MEIGEYFSVIVVLLLVVSVGSAQLSSDNYNISMEVVTDGGDGTTSTNYDSSAVVGIISGSVGSDNYTNELGVFYGLNVAPDDPVVTINTSSGWNISSDDILCNADVNDNDGGTFTVETRWYLNGSLNLTINYSSVSSGAFSSTLNSDNTTKHENWSCDMRIYDGELYSAWGNSSNITILNVAPFVVLTSPANNNITTDRTPTFNWTSTDADNDILTYEINITPYVGGNPFGTEDTRHVVGLEDLNYTPLTNLQYLSDNLYYYVWKVRASDGEVNGSWSDERNINIQSSVSLKLISDDIYFGALGVGESINTDDELSPFVIENDGTVFINVSVNASSLWEQDAPDNYQFKADNNSTESDSFNWVTSIINWTNMPLTGFVVAIDNLKYADSSDNAEVDINVTVPTNEEPGIKNSTITFKAELAE